jgi:hypothetical protein
LTKNKDKLDEDFNKFNQNIEQETEKELNKLHEDINMLKEKVDKMSKSF